MNPKKAFLMDPGFSLLGGSFTENRGRLRENVVAFDFIGQRGRRPEKSWHACWELNAKNEKREFKGFAEAQR